MRTKLLAELHGNEDRKMAIQGAEEPSTPIANLEKWLQHKSPFVRVAIAKRKDLSLKMMLVLAQDSSVLVRSELARSPIISEQIAATLAQDLSLIVVGVLVNNPALSSRILTFLFEQTCQEQSNPQIQEREICNTCCPSKYYYDPNCPFPVFNIYDPRTHALFDPLLHGEDPASSSKIERFAKHPQTTVQILQQLKNNKYSAVRKAVASSSKITEEIADELAQDLSCWVRARIAKNQVTPQPFLDRLICDRCFNVRLAVAKNPQTSLASLRDLMYDRESDIVEAAMKNIDSPKT